MYGIADNSWVPCPDCRTALVELDGYDRVVGRDAVAYNDGGDDTGPYFLGFGMRMAGFVMSLVGAAVASLVGGTAISLRERKVKNLCRTLLPQYPNTLICPRCLFVVKRR